MKRALRIVLAVTVLLVALQPVMAQNYMLKQKSHTDETKMMGQTEPATDVIQTLWFTKDAIATVDEGGTVITDLKNKKIITIDHEEKSYTEMPMDFAMGGDDEEEAGGMAAMMRGLMKSEVSVEPTGEKKKVGKWNCKGYKFTLKTMMGPLTQIMYATKDTDMDADAYRQYMTSAMAMFPGLKDKMKEVAKEMKKIKGVVVRTEVEMKVMGSSMKSYTEVLEIKKGKAPAGTFKIPAGYKRQSGFEM